MHLRGAEAECFGPFIAFRAKVGYNKIKKAVML